jgi:hypothetical protein
VAVRCEGAEREVWCRRLTSDCDPPSSERRWPRLVVAKHRVECGEDRRMQAASATFSCLPAASKRP